MTAVPLSWKACVKSFPHSPFPFLSGGFVFRSAEEEDRDRFLLNCLLGKASSFSAALLPGGGGVQHNDKCQENFKVFLLPSLPLPSPLFPKAANKLFLVARTRRTLLFALPSSPPPRDNDEKRRLFPPLSDLLLKSAACCYILYVPPLLRPPRPAEASRSPLVDCSFPQGTEGVSDPPPGIWELILHYSQQRESGRRLDRSSSSQIVWGKRTFSHEIPCTLLFALSFCSSLIFRNRGQGGVDLSRAPPLARSFPQCSPLKTRTEICTLYIPSGAPRRRRCARTSGAASGGAH